MSKRDIYREAKLQGLDITHYQSGHSGPALTFDSSGHWYEVTTRAPDGTEMTHGDTKEWVLHGLRKHGADYRQSLTEPITTAQDRA